MNTNVTIDLQRLPSLGELFAHFNAGRHLNRMNNHSLWAELEREQGQYEALFAALGYTLRIDGRGFAWFHFEDGSSNVSKTTRQLALLLMLIFEFKADAGVHLARFGDWQIDHDFLAALIEKNQMLLKAENLAEVEALAQVMRAAANYGFATPDAGGWRLLPAVFRYLDRFEELARLSSNDATEGAGEDGGDDGYDTEEFAP